MWGSVVSRDRGCTARLLANIFAKKVVSLSSFFNFI
jgi:hypothetical protein